MGQQHRKHRLVVPLLCTLATLQMLTWICAQDLDSPEYISSLGAEICSPPTTCVYIALHSCVANAKA